MAPCVNSSLRQSFTPTPQYLFDPLQAVDAPSVSKLAASAAAMYAQALKAQREAPELAELDPSWARHLNFQEVR